LSSFVTLDPELPGSGIIFLRIRLKVSDLTGSRTLRYSCLQTWTSFSLRKKAAAAARRLEALTASTWGPGEGGRTTGGCGLAALGAVRLNEIPRGFVGADTFA
jgi:hypothetical protein